MEVSMEASTSTGMDAGDRAAWLESAMDVPVTAALGSMAPLIRELYGLVAPQHRRPTDIDAINTEIQQLRQQDLMKVLFISLKNLSEAEDTSFTAKWWMKVVREICYDTEDHLDEVIMMHSDAGTGMTARVLRCIRSNLKLQQPPLIASDISQIMARLKNASNSLENLKLAPETTGSGSEKPAVDTASSSVPIRSWCRPMDDLIKLLALDDDSQKQLKVVSIFGSAGVGKTTAARTLYGKFGGNFQCRAFLRVSRNPDIRRLLTSFLSQIKAPQVCGFLDVHFLTAAIREHLQDKRFFIIIDDLWSTSVWDIIKHAFPDGDCSRIITTTQVKDVSLANCSYHLTYRYEMSPLNDDQSAQMFFIRVFGSEDGCPADLKEISYEIIRECGGSPLAIVNIASLFSSSVKLDRWKHIQYSLSSALKTNLNSEGMKEILNLMYNNLPPHLKTCFLYLCMYPEGYTVSKDELVKQWVAEGFLGERQDAEQIARDYFDVLVSRGIIQPIDSNYNGEVLSCTVHHLVLDFIRYKSMEDNFIVTVDNVQTTPRLADKVRRLSVQFCASKTAGIPESIILSQVRSLLFSGFLKFVPKIVEYRFLRVLILCIWADHDKTSFDLTGIDELLLLRYLKIDCNVTVELPAKIRGMKHLGTLEVNASLSAVPSDIGRVESLLRLRLPSDNVLDLDLDNPTNLQDLYLTCSAGPPHRVVRNIKQLGSILGKCHKLHSLILDDATSPSSISIFCDGLSRVSPVPAYLQRLELLPRVFIFPSLPKWLGKLRSLCILKIAVRELSKEDIDILKRLPALAALSLYVWIIPGERIVFDNGFTALRYFKFKCNALWLAFSEGAMPNVQRLKLRFNSNKLEKYNPVHAGFEHLLGLKEISAKIGRAGVDEYDSKAALLDVFSKHIKNSPIFHVKLVDPIIHDDEHKRGDIRVSVPREELISSSPEIQGRKKRWSRMDHHLTVASFQRMYAETVRGYIYLLIAGPSILEDQVEFMKQEMGLMTSIIERNTEDDLEDKWVPHLQDLVYDIDDYISMHSSSLLMTNLRMFYAQVSHMRHLRGRIKRLREWRYADKPSKSVDDTIATTMPGPSQYGPYGTSHPPYAPWNELVGMKEPREELLELLFQAVGESTRLISIVGCSGSGKSTLAAVVYDDLHVRSAFYPRAWVMASECSNAGDLANKIFQQLNPEESYKTAFDIYALTDIMSRERCLVVIDEMQRAEVWNDILRAFPTVGHGSRIIVTTSIQSVATAAAANFGTSSHIYTMRGLGIADSRKLFWRKVYGYDTEPAPALVDGSERILKKCDGLPLALVTTANDVPEHHQGSKIEWFGTNYQKAFGHCYNSLPDNGHRKCLLSLSVFPQGHQIKRKSVIRRWISEGLVVRDGRRNEEEVGRAHFNELIDRNLIEPVLIGNNSNVKRCRVNGAMLEFMVNKAFSTNFSTLIRKDEPVSNANPHPVRRLAVHGDTGSGNIASGIGLSVIRSLTIINCELFDFRRCKLLRVLDLEGCMGLDDIVLRAVCQLLILKYLSLRGSDVRRIPRGIRRLHYLETLDIRETKVDNLPMEVMMLPQLVHLFGQFELPQELRDETKKSKLQRFLLEKSKLQTISGFVMKRNSGLESIYIVLHMRSIRKVKIWCKRYLGSTDVKECDLSSLQELFAGSNICLESLSIDSDSYPTDFLHSLRGPCMISSIKIRGTLFGLPEFLSSFDTNLSDLQLSCTGLSCHDLSVLQKLRCLLYLKLSEVLQGFIGGILEVQTGGFPSLERLWLEAPMLPQLDIKPGGMTKLTSLRLHCLPEYAGWCNVKGIENLHHLKEVLLNHSVDAIGLEAWKMTAMKNKNRPKVSNLVMMQSIIPW